MYGIVVWTNEDTIVPSIIGPYESDLVFDDANLLRKQCHKVLVGNLTTPEECETLKLLTKTS